METTTDLKFIIDRSEQKTGPDDDKKQNNKDGTDKGDKKSSNHSTDGTSNGDTGRSSVNQNTENSTIAVPNTGERIIAAKTSGQSALFPIFIGLFLALAIAIIAKAIHKQRKAHLRFNDESKFGIGPLQISLAGSSTLALIFLGAAFINNASIENQKTASADSSSFSISSLGKVEKKIEKKSDDESEIYVVKDTIKVEGPAHQAYKVLIRAEKDSLCPEGDEKDATCLSPIVPLEETDKDSSEEDEHDLTKRENAWGYTLDYDTDSKQKIFWKPVSTSNTEAIAMAFSIAPGDNSNSSTSIETDIYFGINPSNNLKDSTYSTKLTYSVEPISPDDPPEPKDPEDPDDGIANCSDTVHPTADAGCRMADGKVWILGGGGDEVVWNDAFTGATGEDGHDADMNSAVTICPAGYILPKITDFDALVQAYGGAPFATPVHLRDAFKESTGALYNALGLSVGGDFWSSTENTNELAFVLHVSNDISATHGVGTKSGANRTLCYKSDSVVSPENPTEPENPTDPENPDTPTNPENPTDPENPTEPENPVNPIADCTDTVHPTADAGCKMGDGRVWIFGNNGARATWTDLFDGVTGEDGTNGAVKDGICPEGYSAPTKGDYEALASSYSNGGGLYTVLGASSTNDAQLWSATQKNWNGTAGTAYRLNPTASSFSISGFSTGNGGKILCYK